MIYFRLLFKKAFCLMKDNSFCNVTDTILVSRKAFSPMAVNVLGSSTEVRFLQNIKNREGIVVNPSLITTRVMLWLPEKEPVQLSPVPERVNNPLSLSKVK